MKKECLGFKVEKWDKDSKPLFNAWSEKREVFPCVPVSEHEAYKEKVNKIIKRFEDVIFSNDLHCRITTKNQLNKFEEELKAVGEI